MSKRKRNPANIESISSDECDEPFTGFIDQEIEDSERKLMCFRARLRDLLCLATQSKKRIFNTENNIQMGVFHDQNGEPKYLEDSDYSTQESNSSDVFEETFTGFTDKDSERKFMTSYTKNNFQMVDWNSLNLYFSSMKHVFTYLHTKDLISATKVCHSWKLCASDNYVWQNVCLKNSIVRDWDKLIEIINSKCVISLDTSGMLMPSNIYEFEQFWLKFSLAIHNAKKLKALKLYRCPVNIVCYVMHFLQQLEVLDASSIKNSHEKTCAQNVNGLILFDMDSVSQMKNLREFRIKCPTGIKLISTPKLTFAYLANLKTLSLTSIKTFPKDICTRLGTVSTELEALEIGDCECLNNDFPMFLKKLINLKSLRLENCCGRWVKYSKDYFDAIKSLKKLKTLELININFNDCVEQELQKCNGITALLIIPSYEIDYGKTIGHLLECLEKLYNTLTHVVWGITLEFNYMTGLFMAGKRKRYKVDYKPDGKQLIEPLNHRPIVDLRKHKPQPEDLGIHEMYDVKLSNCDTLSKLSVLKLETLLKAMMANTKINIIKVKFSETTQTYIKEHYDVL